MLQVRFYAGADHCSLGHTVSPLAILCHDWEALQQLLFQLIAYVGFIAADNNDAALDQFGYESVEFVL